MWPHCVITTKKLPIIHSMMLQHGVLKKHSMDGLLRKNFMFMISLNMIMLELLVLVIIGKQLSVPLYLPKESLQRKFQKNCRYFLTIQVMWIVITLALLIKWTELHYVHQMSTQILSLVDPVPTLYLIVLHVRLIPMVLSL